MIAWMLYAGVIGALLALAGLAAERLLAGIGRPRRFAWLTVLTLAVVIPLVGGLRGPAETVGDANATASKDGLAKWAQIWSAVPPLPLFSGPSSARTAGIAWGAASSSCLIAMIAFLVFVTRARLRWPRHRIDGAEVRLSRGFGPAVVGIIRPTVVIPSWVLDRDGAEQGTILRHELEHARERDHLVLLYAGLLAAAFPLSPAVWWMLRRLRAAVEMDCDRRVISSGIAATDYGRILVGAAVRSRNRWGLAPAIGQPRSLLERRLRTMNGGQITLNRAHGALLATVALMALGIACDVPAPTQLDDAIGEAVADGRGDLPGVEPPEVNLPTIHLPAFVLIDGERIPIPEARAAYWSNRMREAFRRRNYRITTVSEETAAVLDGPLRRWLESVAPEDINRVRIKRGSKAEQAHGEEASAGVIEVFSASETDTEEETTWSGDFSFSARSQGDWTKRFGLSALKSKGEDVLEPRSGVLDMLVQLLSWPELEYGDIRVRGQSMSWEADLSDAG